MENPIRVLREEQGHSRARMARLLGVTYWVLRELERGYHREVPQGVREGLRRLGVDPDQMASRYQDWRDKPAGSVKEAAK